MFAELRASRHNATLILTLSDPSAKNALHPDMCAATIETLSTAERNDEIRAVILTGDENVFCAGGNLHRLMAMRNRDPSEQAEVTEKLHACIEAIRDCPKPVIAAVEGAAAGAGFALALACDFIVAGANAQFLTAYAKVGLTPDGGSSWFLSRALPRQLAAEMLIESKPYSAQRLHALGLVNRIVADGYALNEAREWSDDIAAMSPNAVQRIKALVRDAQTASLQEQFEAEKKHFVESLYHRDAQEGINAFFEKRPPRYR
ncbi:MAG: enoyl-CoA hydratase [Paucimonas sp.]|jgi:enoyl-CoA hydratase/carnithine racemase|nr:enoyl-CoA hydratase [Paucimonas sp.]